MRGVVRLASLVALLALAPTAVFAQVQATLTGTVKDTSGAVLPGVTVEASSPVLIEKTRSAVTDGTGQYRIVDLRPGTYTVTFTLTGFSSVKREGIELSGSFVATVNADMKVGAVEETITVSGETPIVDVQSTRRQTTLSGETVNAIPTARGYAGIMVLMPSVITQSGTSADVQVTPGMVVFGGAGGRSNEGRLTVDGLNTGASLNGAGVSGYNADLLNAAEVVTTNSGGLGEAEVGGPAINVVPKTGGNSFKGSAYGAYVGSGMVSSNYSTALQNAGLSSPLSILKLWDADAGVGGPIKKDRVWFFINYRDEGSWQTIPGIFANQPWESITTPISNAAAPWNVAFDRNIPARNANSWQIASGRLSTQINSKNKINFFWDEQHPCNGATWTPNGDGCRKPSSGQVFESVFGSPNTSSPEAGGYSHRFQRVQQGTWSSPATNRLLLEAGYGTYLSRWGTNRRPDSVTADVIRVTEGCSTALGCANNGGIAGLNYRSEAPFDDWIGAHVWRASASYVTGAHSFKFGYQGAWHQDQQKNFPNSTYTTYTLQNGVASCSGAQVLNAANSCQGVSIAETLQPYQIDQNVRFDALYAQEQYTSGRFTFQGAVRFDHAWSYYHDETVGGVRFLPGSITFAENDPTLTTPSVANCATIANTTSPGVVLAKANGCANQVTGFKDITPRGGVAWDVRGDGKTSVKVSIGKYLEAASSGNGVYTSGNPVSRMPTGAGIPPITRSWNDVNKNFVPDCVLENPLANGECGNLSNPAFGTPTFTNSFDSTLMGGWGVRPNDWGFVASVQQQLVARTSVEFNYTRRWLANFVATDNLATQTGDYRPFSIVAPTDARLGAASGQTINGLFAQTQAAALATPNNFATLASNLGANQYQRFNGFLMNVQSRVRSGLTLSGGFNTGKTVSDNCEVRAQIPELSGASTTLAAPAVTASNPWCHLDTGWVTRATALASYVIPKVDVLASGTFRSDQGGMLAANYLIPLTLAQAGGLVGTFANNVSPQVNLVQPGTLYGDRVNELDFKFAKIFRFGGMRLNAGLEIYNALNAAATLTYNQTFNPAVPAGPGGWLQPTQVMTPRFFKFTAQFDF
ncbi:MAG TPA: carboxypeptidase-like regulatory domain-containing protein [Vicinamibacterales bacterium]|nr:carboxypeptidase-like regulatory domain-containing protein [Vicinamibacterales bacterium]